MRIRCNCGGGIEKCTEDGIECYDCEKEYSIEEYMFIYDSLEDQEICEYCRFFASQCECSFCDMCNSFIDCTPGWSLCNECECAPESIIEDPVYILYEDSVSNEQE